MSPVDSRFWLVVLVTAAATLLLARLAVRLGLGDASTGKAAARKLQRRGVPTVGGAAILIGLAVSPHVLEGPEGSGSLVFLSLGAVFLVGALDDWLPDGLSPSGKLALQTVAVVPLAFVYDHELGLLFPIAAVVALNVLNTFDNADGAVGSVSAVGFGVAGSWWLPAVLGFLPFNLNASRDERGATPTAYLGDAGAFVLALACVVEPAAWAVLWIPFLDLGRLSIVRWRAGVRPWIGDRRHLAHRLQLRGWPPARVALVLAGLALPGCLGARFGTVPWIGLGLAVGGVLFLVVLRLAPGAAPTPGEMESENATLGER